ncbi:manganese/zinc/iron transport system substrate-binding protein [Deinococcus sp. HSC-46F16]|uniref:metal ABC transporter solute-binding protein, Zn/Mn family n=1 Tax=Deinococcus sp. HSC-46F16 TaxID=2910968 RepID=UPI00209CAC56|nr:zinc ABC transporter substrate-binding protein [Deinococcus sp. HSC-46F16]MCP2015291.1 manganese/zinc/iron transport system substrate-binding protein [Deinococcus sp. HSC-46F16]
MKRGLLLLAALGLGACAPSPTTPDDGRVQVVTTVNMLSDLAAVIGGERVRVTGLMGPGVDPHLYKASAGDVRRLAGADLVLYGGLHLEGKMVDVLHALNTRTPSVALFETLPRDRLLGPAGAPDPHIWFDPTLWAGVARGAAKALTRVDPDGREVYAANLTRYLGELEELDRWTAAQFRTVPERQRVLVTAHDAFNYMARRYGVEVQGVQGISTVAEAGGQRVRALAAFLDERDIRAVFVESTVSPRTVEAVREAARARGHAVELGGSLYADAAGDPGTPEGTYLGMVRHNVTTIVEGLR